MPRLYSKRLMRLTYLVQHLIRFCLVSCSRINVKTGGSNKRSREDAEGAAGDDKQEEEERGGEKAMKRMLDSLPPTLRVVTNFGLVDICPLRSGKHNAAAYLAREHFGIPLANCASMGDDDNDIALVRAEGVVSQLQLCFNRVVFTFLPPPCTHGLLVFDCDNVSQNPRPGLSKHQSRPWCFFLPG